jgi:hypothetical protein
MADRFTTFDLIPILRTMVAVSLVAIDDPYDNCHVNVTLSGIEFVSIGD